jgi:hypothetical protein
MNVFRLHAERVQEGTRDSRTWFIIADSLTDAVSLVPEGFYVKDAEIGVIATSAYDRMIGRIPGPTAECGRLELNAGGVSVGTCAGGSGRGVGISKLGVDIDCCRLRRHAHVWSRQTRRSSRAR